MEAYGRRTLSPRRKCLVQARPRESINLEELHVHGDIFSLLLFFPSIILFVFISYPNYLIGLI
jgi:hypothetical protein